MNTKLSLLAGAALAVLGFAAPANASVFTQTVTFGPAPTDYNGTGPGTGSVLLFDTNGGTLNSITFSSSYGFNSTITVSDNSQTGSSGNANTESAAQFTAGSSAATTALNTDINTGGHCFIGAGSLSPIAYDIQGSKSQYTLAPNGGSQQLTSTGTTVSNAAVTDTTAADLAAFSNAGGGNLAIGFDTPHGHEPAEHGRQHLGPAGHDGHGHADHHLQLHRGDAPAAHVGSGARFHAGPRHRPGRPRPGPPPPPGLKPRPSRPETGKGATTVAPFSFAPVPRSTPFPPP